MRIDYLRRTLWALLAVVLAGCTTYRPAPLAPAAEEALKGPALAALIAPAASFQHPLLRPVAIDVRQPLTPDAVAILAVLANPDLKAARAKAAVSAAQVFSTGLLPDPTFNLSYDVRLAGPDPSNGWAAAVTYELAALRDRADDLKGAREADRQVRLDLAWQEWQTAEQAKLLAARVLGLGAVEPLVAQTKAEADAALARALQAAQRGDVKSDEVETRRLAAIDASDKFAQAEKDLSGARLDLDRLLGLPPRTVLQLVASPPPVPAGDADSLFRRARERRLDLKALEAGYASQDAAVRKAILDQFPSFQLTVNRAQDTAKNQTIGPAVNFTLPVWNGNRGGIRVAEATRDQLRAEYAARVFAARADIADLLQALDIANRQRQATMVQIEPLQRIATATAAAAARGDVAPASAEAVRQSLRDKQAALVALDQAIAEQSVSLELATGGPMS